MKKIIVLLCILVFPAISNAACGGSSPTLTAASAERDDVAACFAIATHGDTINIPAGEATWDEPISFVMNLTIKGAGKTATVLTENFTGASSTNYMAFFKFTPDATARSNIDNLTDDTAIFEISDIGFVGAIRSYIHGVLIYNQNETAIRRVRIHDNAYTKLIYATYPVGDVFGVFDNNTLDRTRMAYYLGNEQSSWNNNRTSLGGPDAWYMEDNVSSTENGYPGNLFGGGHALSVVARYNQTTGVMGNANYYWENHGNQKGNIYGTQIVEVYGNDLACVHYQAGKAAVNRGGKTIAAYNRMGAQYAIISLWEEYSDEYSGTTTTLPAVFTINDTYYINNRKISNATLATLPIGYDCHDRTAIPKGSQCYSIETTIYGNTTQELVENREYFNHKDLATFQANPNEGVTCGTAEQMNALTPTTVGVGFWVPTDIAEQPCTSVSSNNVGTNPKTKLDGTLYKWGGDSWEEFWTPYEYPHPLRGETPPDPEEGPWLVSVGGDAGCYFVPHNPAYVEDGLTTEVGVYAATNYSVATVSGCGGTWGGEGTYTTAAVTGDCEVACTSKKLSPDTAIGSGAAVKFGVGAGAIVR